MKIDKVEVGFLKENCYLVEKDNHLLIVDPGDEFDKIKVKVGNNKVDGVLITHNHFDHVGALKDVIKEYNIEVYNIYNLKEGINNIKDFEFEVIYTKGHKSDAISFYFKEINSLLCGDFIFKESIGRWDLETGSKTEMLESIKKIKTYDDSIIIYPGHGEKTKLQHEKQNNPYFK